MNYRVIPIHPAPSSSTAVERKKQAWRLLAQMAFFTVFVLTPLFDVFRYDLTRGHAYFLGMEWHLGIDALLSGQVDALSAAFNILLRLFVPIAAIAVLVIGISWKWGRLYCGWLCPHFSVVETVNRLMIVATGKPSLWERRPLPGRQADGNLRQPDRRAWALVLPLALGFALVWAVVLLSYLMPPLEMYPRLFSLSLQRYEAIFIGAATLVLSLEFLLARHLFCKYACAVGMFQSLAWMGNRQALVVGVDRSRLAECADCLQGEGSACEAACPMRLKPRSIKRLMFACTQCSQCISACATVQQDNPRGSLLAWVQDEAASQLEGGFKAPRSTRMDTSATSRG
ncbi:4Fe-4S binding protein [Denitratisoma oestradiolicum]|uniref:4Fe-4S binding protein n=1 Tax=Denitratisoma oestradiolicum TaxID=311182 RepID=A0A6S6Y4W4_9PROT|nr:4Fe-4S binding protein [Denitratisoma oestradiolicum]TWO79620.1 4Fe-4S binding protein [Denitratisoma oestradiolicum]CAB1370420.1 4Fe-4S binding protein [Denitratisoma oestradiolicum]